MHLDLLLSLALAGLASPALDVETEPPCAVPPQARIGRAGEQGADVVEQLCVRRRVGAGGAPDRRLVDLDHLVDLIDPRDLIVFTGPPRRLIELLGHAAVEHVLHQRALPRSGDAGDADELPQRDLHVDILQVVLARADHADELSAPLSALSGDGDEARAGQVLSGDRIRICGDLLRRPCGDDLPPVRSGSRSEVDDVVALPHRLLVVLDDDHRVPQVAQPLQRRQQAAVVPLVQTDRRLVEDVQHTCELASDLRRQADALRLPPGERPRPPVEGEVAEADGDHEPQPGPDLL